MEPGKAEERAAQIRHPDRVDKLWVWNLPIFIRSLDTFPAGESQGWKRTGHSAASEHVL